MYYDKWYTTNTHMLTHHHIIFFMLMVRYSSGEQEMDKDTLTRNLKLVWRIVVGISVLLPPEQVR
jgi:hypothetical protein